MFCDWHFQSLDWHKASLVKLSVQKVINWVRKSFTLVQLWCTILATVLCAHSFPVQWGITSNITDDLTFDFTSKKVVRYLAKTVGLFKVSVFVSGLVNNLSRLSDWTCFFHCWANYISNYFGKYKVTVTDRTYCQSYKNKTQVVMTHRFPFKLMAITDFLFHC